MPFITSPHTGAPMGNALVPTDLDIESVEIVPGRNFSTLWF